MEILATQTFMQNIEGELDDLEFWKLQDYVCDHPESGKLIPHARGLRKLRWGTGEKGKRGGLRVIYYYKIRETILFVAAYRKSKQEDLTPKQLKKLVKLIEDE
jgi:mRNA-degrading endonuclease RelE of RelBE toxin-antitoxin system